MSCEGAMDIDLPTEVGPTEEIVEALMEYLVGPLLPLKHTEFAKEPPSESKQKSVAKQVHAAVVLYNYYHLNHHRENRFLKFDQFCKLATVFKPGILRHMKYTCHSDDTVLNDPENQLSITENAVMDACTISETLLNASVNISNDIKEWQITKVAVLLIDSKKESCFLQFNNGVWSVIEKEVYPESKKRTVIMMEYDNEGEVGFQKLAFSAVKEAAGIVDRELKVLESHVVYSLSRAKTATQFYIVQSTREINEDNLVPIQDVISSLQGPVVKKCLGSWIITPVVEYYYLLPYAEILSKLFSRESNNLTPQVKEKSADVNIIQASCEKETDGNKKVFDYLQKKSKLDSEFVHNSYSSKEEAHDSKDSQNTCKSDQCSKNEISESKEVFGNLPKKSKLNHESAHNSNLSKDKPCDSKVSKNTHKPNQCSEKEGGESKEVSDDLQKESKFDSDCESKKVSDDSQRKSKLDSESVEFSNSSKEEPLDRKVSENTHESNRCGGIEGGENKEVLDNLQKGSKLESEIMHISSSIKEESHDFKVSEIGYEPNQFSYAFEPVSKVADDPITSPFTVSPVDQKVKESIGNGITVSNSDGMEQGHMNGSCRAELEDSSSGANNKMDTDELSVCFQEENRNTKFKTPLKVYRREKRSTPTNSTNRKVANLTYLKKMSTISPSKDERVNDEKGSCMVPPNEDRSLTVNYILEDFQSTVDAKRSEISDAALRVLLNKRQKLYDEQRVIKDELTLCEKKIQAIMHGGVGDCLDLKLEAVIDCCNEICKQDDMQTQQDTDLLVSRSVPLMSGKNLSEARLTLRKACQELDDICLSNNWTLPTYRTSRSDGGFVSNVTVKGANFECSAVSGDQPSIHEARNSAATHVIIRLQQMANGTNAATLV